MKDNTRFYYKKNRLQQTRGFCATVQCNCSIRKASVMLGIEHSTISLQIKSLEDDLNTKLFKRYKNNRMMLTKDGDLFYKKAIIHLQGIDSLFEYFNSNLEKDTDNSINIACDNLTVTHILPEHLNHLRQEVSNFNKLKINIDITTLEDLFKKLMNNSVNLALFCYLPSINIPVEIQEENINTYKNCLVSGKNDIRSVKCILSNKTFNESYSNYIRTDNLNINISNENPLVLKNFVKYSLTSYVIPELILDKNDYKSFNINKDNLFSETYFSIFYVKNYIKKINIEKFISIIKSNKIS